MRRYELADEQWELIADLFPPEQGNGRPWSCHRSMVNALLWILNAGSPWRDLPERYGPWQTAYNRFNRWRKDGTFDAILERLQMRLDEEGRIDWDLWMVDGSSVRAHASAALDISDGFLKDLARLSGNLGIEVRLDALPLSSAVRAVFADDAAVADAILGGGDDYELLIAVPPSEIEAFSRGARLSGIGVSDVGVLEAGRPIAVIASDGTRIAPSHSGYDHFSR